MKVRTSIRPRGTLGALLLAAFVAGGGPASADPAPKAVKTADAGGLARDASALGALAEKCRQGTLDVMEACARRDPLTEDECSTGDIAYSVCVSLIPGQDASRSFFGGKGSAHRSRDHSLHARLAWAAIRGTDADVEALYPEMAQAHGGTKNARQLFDLLASNLKRGEGAKSFCGAAEGLRDWKGKCEESVAFLDGAPEECGNAQECRDEAGLVAALRSKDPKACEASPLCRALTTHEVRSCQYYLTRAADLICIRIAEGKTNLEKRQKAEAAVRLKAEQSRMQETERKRKLQQMKRFKSGESMQTVAPDVQARMQAIEKAGAPAPAASKPTNGGAQ